MSDHVDKPLIARVIALFSKMFNMSVYLRVRTVVVVESTPWFVALYGLLMLLCCCIYCDRI